MAKYLLATVVRDHRGEPMIEKLPTGDLILTLSFVLERACMFGGDADMKQDAKFRQYKLAQRIARSSKLTSEPIELEAEEIVALKKLCAQIYSPIAYGAIAEMLETQQWHPPVEALPADIAAVIGEEPATAATGAMP